MLALLPALPCDMDGAWICGQKAIGESFSPAISLAVDIDQRLAVLIISPKSEQGLRHCVRSSIDDHHIQGFCLEQGC